MELIIGISWPIFRAWQLRPDQRETFINFLDPPSRNPSSRLAIIIMDDLKPASTSRINGRYYGVYPEGKLPCHRYSVIS